MSAERIRMRVTLTSFYDADPQHYGEMTAPAEMAELDEQQWTDDPFMALSSMDEEWAVRVEPEPTQPEASARGGRQP